MPNRPNAVSVRELTEIKITPLTLAGFIQLIEAQPGFAFARLSDGAFFCLQGRKGQNCDGVVYTEAQAQALRQVILDDTITHGLTSIAIYTARAREWLLENNLQQVTWLDADVMNKASDDGQLLPFVECLRQRDNLICGPEHLKNFSGIPVSAFVRCHGSRAFEEVDELEAEICYRVEKSYVDTVLLSAGQAASPTLVSRLHELYPQLTVLDVGSLWDPYVQVFSRSGHKKRGWDGYKKLGWKNFNEDITAW